MADRRRRIVVAMSGGVDSSVAAALLVDAGHDVVGSMKVAAGDGQHWAHPVIAGGRLYIRHGGALLAYALRSCPGAAAGAGAAQAGDR